MGVPFEIKGCNFLPHRKGLLRQVNCLEIQPESRDGILVAGLKSTPENKPSRILKVRSSNTFIRSAENDRYHKCAGDAMKKCVIESMQVYEHELEKEDPEAGDDANDDYIGCIEKQTKACRYPIMRHVFEQTEAYKKHVKQLEILEAEERQ